MTILSNKHVTIIAEMANAHEGSFLKAKEIIVAAADANADIIKFQKFTANELLTKDHEKFDEFKKLEMSNSEWKKIIKLSKQKNLKVLFDVFSIKSAKEVLSFNDVDGIKIHTSDTINPKLLKFLSNQKISILLSTGGSTFNEIDEAIKILNKLPKEIILLHGFQSYPTKLKETNLLRLNQLRKKFQKPIGLMDHISGDSDMSTMIPLIAVGMGVNIIEKHITLDRSKKETDYYSSLNPNEFKKMVSLIRETETALGSSQPTFSKEELQYRINHRKNPILKSSIKKGTILHEKLFDYKRTKIKINSVPFFEYKNKKISKNLILGTPLTSNLLENHHRVAAVIACRVDSERLYAKPMQLLNNHPILELLIEQIKSSKLIDEIILAISEKPGNEIFIEFALKNNIKFVIGDDEDVLDRLVLGAEYVNCNIIFRVTSENPFIYWEGIDLAIKKHIDGKYDFSFIDGLPIGASFELINFDALEKSHKKGKNKHRSELCSLYIYENKKSFKINTIQAPKMLHRPNFRLTVDTPEDLIVARLIYKKLGKNLKPIPLNKIIQYLDKNKFVMDINSEIPLGVTRIWS